MAEANRSDETELPGVIRQLNAIFASMGIVDFCESRNPKDLSPYYKMAY